jgi:hypothetical protein
MFEFPRYFQKQKIGEIQKSVFLLFGFLGFLFDFHLDPILR